VNSPTFTILGLAKEQNFDITEIQLIKPQHHYSTMTTPKTLTITPRLSKDKKVVVLNLKPIRTRIEQAIRSFPRKANVVISSTTKKIDRMTVDVMIRVQDVPKPPGNGAAHPPRKIEWGTG
jgi:hypothetical protein